MVRWHLQWPQPEVLCPGYLLRILAIRFCLVCFCISALDCALAAGAAAASGWGWGNRAGLAGLLLPLLLNLVGLVWPFVQLSTFEEHYKGLHLVLTYGSILGKVLEGLGSTSTSASGWQQSMLLHGMLFIVQQQDNVQHFVVPLAVMLTGYSACYVVGHAGSLISHTGAGAASASAAAGASGASVLLAGESFTHTFMLLLLFNHLYTSCVGSREQAPPQASQPQAQQASKPLAATGGPASRRARAFRAYLVKLAGVKLVNAASAMLHALQSRQQALMAQGSLPGSQVHSADGSAGAATDGSLLQPHVVGFTCAAILGCHALVAICCPRWFKCRATAINWASFYACLAARLYLMQEHIGSSSTPDAGVAVEASSSSHARPVPGVPPDHALHSFLGLAFSLSTHEDPLPLFAVQLSGLALLYRSVRLQLLGSMQPAAGTAASFWELPQYLLVVIVMVAVYKWLCVCSWRWQDGCDTHSSSDGCSTAPTQLTPAASAGKQHQAEGAAAQMPAGLCVSDSSAPSDPSAGQGVGRAADCVPGSSTPRRSIVAKELAAIPRSSSLRGSAASAVAGLAPRRHSGGESAGPRGSACKLGPSSMRRPSVDIRVLAGPSFELPLASSLAAAAGAQQGRAATPGLTQQQLPLEVEAQHMEQRLQQLQQQDHCPTELGSSAAAALPPSQKAAAQDVLLLSSLYASSSFGSSSPVRTLLGRGHANSMLAAQQLHHAEGASAALPSVPEMAATVSPSAAVLEHAFAARTAPLLPPSSRTSSADAGESMGFAGAFAVDPHASRQYSWQGSLDAADAVGGGVWDTAYQAPLLRDASLKPASGLHEGIRNSFSSCDSVDSLERSDVGRSNSCDMYHGGLPASSFTAGMESSADVPSSSCANGASPVSTAGSSGVSQQPQQQQQHQQQQQQQQPVQVQQQRMVCDAVLLLIELAALYSAGYLLLVQSAMQPSAAGSTVWELLACAGALLYLTSSVLHSACLTLQPGFAMKRREVVWLVRLCLAPLLLHLPLQLAGADVPRGAQQLLVLVGGACGLLEVQTRRFSTWLPLLAASHYIVGMWAVWPQRPFALLVWDAAWFNLCPLASYLACKVAAATLHKVLGAAATRMCSYATRIAGMRDQQPPKWLLRAAGIAVAMLSQLLVALALVVVLVVSQEPTTWLWPVGARSALDGGRALLWGVLQAASMHSLSHTSQRTLAMVGALLGTSISFAAVSLVQAWLLRSSLLRDPRQRKYAAAKAQVSALGERTMMALAALGEGAGAQDVEAVLLSQLESVTGDCFPGCTLLLVLLEGSVVSSGRATRHVVHPGSDAVAAVLPRQSAVALADLPSVMTACKQRHVIFRSNVAKGCTGYEDWEDLAAAAGLTTFLVVPLSFASTDMGALMLAAPSAGRLDKYLRKLALELSFGLSQTLYTRLCIEQLRAGDQIIHDVLPEKVAEHLRRRVISARSTTGLTRGMSLDLPSKSSTADGFACPTSSHKGLLSRLSEAASALRVQQQQLQQQPDLPVRQQSIADGAGHQSYGGMDTCVVYKQWHPRVSVLFADIVDYTALSRQVEPERVMLLLHELFSKYDHLCTLYGIYKVETIGDCYMACSGVLVDNPDHASHLVHFARAMLAAAASVKSPAGGSVRIRVGIHSGRVMSGIVGSIRARYCLFGDTVNTASRMESTGIADSIQISGDTQALLGALSEDFELRESVAVKGKGLMHTHVLKDDVAGSLREEGLAQAGQA